jgi:hypothetical protein
MADALSQEDARRREGPSNEEREAVEAVGRFADVIDERVKHHAEHDIKEAVRLIVDDVDVRHLRAVVALTRKVAAALDEREEEVARLRTALVEVVGMSSVRERSEHVRAALAVGEGEAAPAPSGGEIAMRMIHAFCEVTEPTIVKAGDICGDWDCLDADDVMFVVHPPTDETPWVEDVRAPILAEPVETCGAEGWEEGRTRRCSLPPGHGWVHDWARPPAAPMESVETSEAGGPSPSDTGGER